MLLATAALALLSLGLTEGAFSTRDRGLLKSFYDSQPSKTFTWDFSKTLCGQKGVVCTSAEPQEVSSLNLAFSGLTGTFPTEFLELKKLTALNINSNSFSGSFPSAQLYKFYNLVTLFAEKNSFSGTLPHSFNIPNLLNLDLSDNQFSGSIPPEFAKAPNLFSLDISNNNITGSIPRLFYKSTSLSILDMHGNSISGTISSHIGSMNLNSLLLHNNRLTGPIPSEIANLFALLEINLSNNQLIGKIPTELANSFALTSLNLANNQLVGPVPEFNFFLMDNVFLAGNNLCPIPDYSLATNNDFSGTNEGCNVCSAGACSNGGQCVPNALGDDFTCSCTSGYNGTYCHLAICNPPCQNGGLCVSPGSPGVCDCGPYGQKGSRSAFTGAQCQTRIFCPASQDGNAAFPTGPAPDPIFGTCLPGFIGAPTRNCFADGRLGPVNNPCIANSTCPSVTYGNAQWPSTPFGSTAFGTCLPGFSTPPGGTTARLCQFSGTWASNLNGYCRRIFCPAEVIGSTSFPATASNSVQTGRCQGATRGRSHRVCNINGTWEAITGVLCA